MALPSRSALSQPTGDFTVVGGTLGSDYTYDSGAHLLTIKTGKPLTISGTTTVDQIAIANNLTAYLTLSDLSIDVSPQPNVCAFSVGTNTTLHLTLAQGTTNILASGMNRAGLEIPYANSAPTYQALIIDGSGSLNAQGGGLGAGIGGNGWGVRLFLSNITIVNGDITARGGKFAAGIGSSNLAPAGTITISGGSVVASGGDSAAGIGGGDSGACKAVSITGGSVVAQGGTSATGIGGGYNAAGGTIAISSGTVSATSGASNVPGIGNGAYNWGTTSFTTPAPGTAFITTNAITDTSQRSSWRGVIFEGTTGQVYGNPKLTTPATLPAGSTLTVSAGTSLSLGGATILTNDGIIENYGSVNNRSNIHGTGVIRDHVGDFVVEGGVPDTDYSFASKTLTVLKDTPLKISNSDPLTPTDDHVVVAQSLNAHITLSGINIKLTDGSLGHFGTCAFDVGLHTALSLTLENDNSLQSGSNKAGLHIPETASLTVEKNSTGTLRAQAGMDGAGIGGSGTEQNGSITINGATVTALGSGGAGIGGGANASGGKIIITGGSVTADGGIFGSGIGGGPYSADGGTIIIVGGSVVATSRSQGSAGIGNASPHQGTFSTTYGGKPGNAFIRATSIGDTSNKSSWSGVIFEGNTGQVYGSPTLATNASVSKGDTLIVPAGSTLSLADDTTFTNAGVIENHGGLTKASSAIYTGSGTLTSDSQLTLSLTPSSSLTYGDAFTIIAKVDEAATNDWAPASPSGMVSFSVGDRSLGQVPLEEVSDGRYASLAINNAAQWNTSGLVAGDNTITAHFAGSKGTVSSAGLFSSGSSTPLSVAKISLHPTVSLSDWVYGSQAPLPVFGPGSNPENAPVTYKYKPKGQPDSAYTTLEPTDAGTYTLCVQIDAGDRYLAGSATCDFTITKAYQAAPNTLVPHAESVAGKADGTIGNLSTAMQYATSKDGQYITVADTKMTFAPGTYWVRFAGDANHEASAAIQVGIAAGNPLLVSLPTNQKGYTITADKSSFSYQEDVHFTFTLAPGWVKNESFAITVNGMPVSLNEKGSFSVTYPEANLKVDVVGVGIGFSTQTLTDSAHKVMLSGMLSNDATLGALPLIPENASYKALVAATGAQDVDIVGVYDVKLTGAYKDTLSLSFKVGQAYAGRTLMLYHEKADGSIETLPISFKAGWVQAQVTSLSPFLIAATKDASVPAQSVVSTVATPSAHAGTPPDAPSTSLAQTGERSLVTPLLIVAVIAGLMVLISLSHTLYRHHRKRGE